MSGPVPSQRPAELRRQPVRLLELRREIPRRWYLGAGVGFIALFLIAWIALTAGQWVSPIFLPSPLAVLAELRSQAASGVLWQDLWASVYRIMVGWVLSTVLAVPIGVLMGNFRFFEGLFEPFIDLVRYMPAVAFVPLTILWLGVGDAQKFAILFIGVFFQQVLMIMDNVKTVPREMIQVSYTFGLSQWEILRSVILPAAMPGIWDTFRITVGWAWTYLVVAELVAANVGLGYRIMRAQRFLETDQIILGILIIGLLGLFTDYLFKWSYRRLFPWALQSR
ncbi:ABC transporter permease [Caldilinea sp.]|jgi:NitT/TauT family transport system permease protein|uniref:ABC transporter permease n=1 Tax=Caldilinea sp. TaxID=2293560 RepID=UPI001B0A61A5|nr:ABC transporter permease [Caldilinea sp.]MBO9394392.1 ABC transporter permease [Caldilinea sp.]GIV68807.1 MAG: ABC transporter permease [Caldilinea sp.]